MKNLIEISSKNAKAGRTPAKFVLHKIYNNSTECNSNGISWSRQYTENNLDSVKGMPLVCQFADDDNQIPFGGHGEMTTRDGEIVFEDSLVVGSFENAYIDDNIDVNGEKISGLVGECYIYNQRFPSLVEYLEEQYSENIPVDSSVEICGDKSKGNSKIIYDGGWKEHRRIPKDYQYSGQALCIGIEPADNSALMIELNSALKKNSKKEGTMEKIKSSQTIELNELSYDDIACLITRAFNVMMAQKDDDYDSYYNYWIYKLYPDSKRVVMYKGYDSPNEYYLTTYEVSNKSIVLGDTTKVEQDWKPVNNEQEAEINASIIKNILKKNNKEVHKMEDNVILELNQKIENKTTEINELTTKNTGLANTNTELNEAVVNANKALEEANSKVTSLTDELNACKEELNALKVEKETAETEAKKVEVNSYFETEIPKNGFAEEEINSLKEYVEKIDLVGLKSAESELCAKKFKEMKLKDVEANSTEAEINSKNVSFITIHEKDKKVISDENVSFFN